MSAPDGTSDPSARGLLVLPALLAALIALAGSLWLSLGMGLKACPLCFYQRSFAMSAAAVLGIGWLAGRQHRGLLPIVALPLAIAALGVALVHVRLELTGALECPAGIFGIGSAPQQSACILLVLTILLAIGSLRACARGGSALAVLIASAVGVALAWASIASSPPLPNPPAAAYDAAPDGCRPPYRAP